ncbi:ABC transporter substrate-binding protein [Leptothrix sp. BB-4]
MPAAARHAHAPERRRWLRLACQAGALGLLAPALTTLPGCARAEPQLRVGSNIWPGYALLHAAEELGQLDPAQVRMIEMPAASDVLQALAAGTIEAGGLTLDELLTARADGLDLVAVLVFDESRGGDAVVARSNVRDLQDLAGRRIGVEQSAVGALVLQAALRSAGLRLDQVEPVVLTAAEHVDAWQDRRIDALVTFEPTVSLLQAQGGRRLFDSRSMPGAILDVLAVHRPVLERHPQGLRKLAAAHLGLLAQWQKEPARLEPVLGRQLGLSPTELRQAYDGLSLPDLDANRNWLGGQTPMLATSANALVDVMTMGRMLPRRPPLEGLTSTLALPAGAPT